MKRKVRNENNASKEKKSGGEKKKPRVNELQSHQRIEEVTRGRAASDTGSQAVGGPGGYYNFNLLIKITELSNLTADVSQLRGSSVLEKPYSAGPSATHVRSLHVIFYILTT